MMRSIVFFLIVFFSASVLGKDAEGKDYVAEATYQSLGQTVKSLEGSRIGDLQFTFVDPLCVCGQNIVDHFKDEVDDQVTDRLYKATDNLIVQFSLILEEIDLEIKKIGNLKQANELYSFSQLYELTSKSISGFPSSYTVSPEGCPAIDVTKHSDFEVFFSVVSTHESGGKYTAKNPNTFAYGRYQFIPSTGEEYCNKAKSSVHECGSCVMAKTASGSKKTRQTWWDSPACQDKMFEFFTRDNQRYLQNHGVAVTTCSLYIAHQQGKAGAVHIYNNKPKDSIKRNMLSNIGQGMHSGGGYTWTQARDAFVAFWSKRFNADILKVSGELDSNSTSDGNSTKEDTPKEKTTQEQRNNFFREGILLELYKQREGLKGWKQELTYEP